MGLIDKNKVVKEIKRRIDDLSTLDKASYEVGLFDAYNIILSFLDSTEVKEVDLEKEIKSWLDHGHITDTRYDDYDDDDIKRTAKHFFELGLKTKKGE